MVNPLRRYAVPESLELFELLVKSLAHLVSSRPADLTLVYDLHGWTLAHHYVVERYYLQMKHLLLQLFLQEWASIHQFLAIESPRTPPELYQEVQELDFSPLLYLPNQHLGRAFQA